MSISGQVLKMINLSKNSTVPKSVSVKEGAVTVW